MKRRGRLGWWLVGLAFCALLLSGCKRSQPIKIDGSSTVYPITRKVVEEFTNENKDIKVGVALSGTGGGFEKFARGEIHISDASRPIKKSEIEAVNKAGMEFIELPIGFGAITIAVHKNNDWCKAITIAELKKIWDKSSQGEITRWSQVRDGWPDKEFKLYGADDKSGTFDYFNEAVLGKNVECRTDYTANADDNVLVRGIAGDEFALGYIPFAYYEKNKDKIQAVAVKWEDGEPTLPTMDNVREGKYNPLSRPLFIYISTKALEREDVQKFVKYYLDKGPKLIEEIGYLPLPEEAYKAVRKRFEDRKTGTVFGGEAKIGASVQDLLGDPK